MARDFEKHLKARLDLELGPTEVIDYYAVYSQAREKLVRNIYSHIQGANPDLTDHSERHVDNVLHNIRKLISTDSTAHRLSAVDLYCLAMFALFHDVGNLFGRNDHRARVGEVFDWARGDDPSLRRERTLVLRAAMAHTGSAGDGTLDTLKEVNEVDHINGHRVAARQLAAILRFADELAEGPHRTSEFLLSRRPDASIHHDYASITNIHIDRPGGRIALTYDISLT